MDAELIARLIDAFRLAIEQTAPGLIEPLTTYDPASALPACDTRRAPVTYAVMVSITVYSRKRRANVGWSRWMGSDKWRRRR